MRLNKIDANKISKGKPAFLRLYDIQEVSEEDLNFLQYLHRYTHKVSASNCHPSIMKSIELQYGNIEILKHNLIIAKKSEWFIELYITIKCNMSCDNCGQFSQFKSAWMDMPEEQIDKFIEDNKGKDLTVNILGGEPTLVKNLDEIILKLDKHFNVMLATNGTTDYTPPIEIAIENSGKTLGIQPEFSYTMEAPRDMEKYKDDDFSLGCLQVDVCGFGLHNSGYYTCPLAGAIDKQLGFNLGSDSMEIALKRQPEVFAKLCGYCGTYKNKNFVHYDTAGVGLGQKFSESWKFMEEVK